MSFFITIFLIYISVSCLCKAAVNSCYEFVTLQMIKKIIKYIKSGLKLKEKQALLLAVKRRGRGHIVGAQGGQNAQNWWSPLGADKIVAPDVGGTGGRVSSAPPTSVSGLFRNPDLPGDSWCNHQE